MWTYKKSSNQCGAWLSSWTSSTKLSAFCHQVKASKLIIHSPIWFIINSFNRNDTSLFDYMLTSPLDRSEGRLHALTFIVSWIVSVPSCGNSNCFIRLGKRPYRYEQTNTLVLVVQWNLTSLKGNSIKFSCRFLCIQNNLDRQLRINN